MKDIIKYWKIISNRWKSSKNKIKFFWWLVLRVKKIFHYGFRASCETKSIRIDLVVPTISKDFALLDTYLKGLKNICLPVNKIYIVSKKSKEIQDFCIKNGCIFVDELSVLGYGKDRIKYQVGNLDRRGWIFQQLLKLSGEKFVEMENYIIVDSDTILLNPHSFVEKGKYVFYQNEEWHEPYFTSFKEIFGVEAKTKASFTSHMMIFNTVYLKRMKDEIEYRHKKSWDRVYLSRINNHEQSCISDYELYANWVLLRYPERICAKPLYNTSLHRENFASLSVLKTQYGGKYNSVSFHSYINSKKL